MLIERSDKIIIKLDINEAKDFFRTLDQSNLFSSELEFSLYHELLSLLEKCELASK
jgi:hypothetical protein